MREAGTKEMEVETTQKLSWANRDGKHQQFFPDTPWKINMEPENTPLEKENHLPNHHFQVLC